MAISIAGDRFRFAILTVGTLLSKSRSSIGGIDGLGKWTSASNKEKEKTSQNCIYKYI